MDTVRWCLSFPLENEVVREVWMSRGVGSPKQRYMITDWNVIQKQCMTVKNVSLGQATF
jgi:hypothetical protein